jgi:hypothetical protein
VGGPDRGQPGRAVEPSAHREHAGGAQHRRPERDERRRATVAEGVGGPREQQEPAVGRYPHRQPDQRGAEQLWAVTAGRFAEGQHLHDGERQGREGRRHGQRAHRHGVGGPAQCSVKAVSVTGCRVGGQPGQDGRVDRLGDDPIGREEHDHGELVGDDPARDATADHEGGGQEDPRAGVLERRPPREAQQRAHGGIVPRPARPEAEPKA